MRLSTSTFLWLTTGLLLAPLSWGEASESAGGATSALIEEVLVTARKKNDQERLQDVPVAISAFSGDQIEAMFAVDLTDISNNVPNASAYSNASFPGYVNFFVRGMGVAGTVLSDDPAVGVFLDGVYQGVSAGLVYDTFDLEAVEVLRGPQGTLFGRNVTGGAALLRTRGPSEEFSGRLRAIAESDGGVQLAASFSGPIVDGALLGKLAVFSTQRDDWMNNPSGNAQGYDDIGEQDQSVVRGALTWLASDSLSVDFRVETGSADDDPLPIWAVDNTLLLRVQPIPGLSEVGAEKGDDPIANGVNQSPPEAEWSSASMEVNWDLAKGTLKSITAWKEFEQSNLTQDFDGSTVALFDVNNSFIEQSQTSQEFVYNLDVTERVDLTSGLFLFNQDFEYGERRFGALFAAAGGGLQTYSETEHEVTGLYAQADIEISDQTNLTLGGRQSWEKKDTQIGQFGSSLSCTDVLGTDPATCEYNFTGDDEWSTFTFKAGAEYKPSEDVLLYASYSRGFRSGGFNIRQNAGVDPGPYDEEVVDAFELGAKADWADGRLRTNVSVFFNEYQDLQRTLISTEGFQSVTNAAEAAISGVELEGTWLVAEGLLLQVSLGYLDAEIQNFVNPRGGADDAPLVIDGTKVPYVPEWQRNVNLTYDLPLGPGSLTFRGSYKYVGETNSTDDNLGYMGDSWDQYDVSVAYAPNSGNWRITAFGRNLTDEIESSLITNARNPGWILNQARNPRRYGVEVLFEF